MHPSPIVSTEWLAKKLNDADIALVDASWHMPDTGRDGAKEYKNGLIPGAVFFDIDKIIEPGSSLPHTMPSEAVFEKAIRSLGISNTGTIIVYDKSDIPTAARAWWMFRTMGHTNVYMLDGGYKKWVAENRPVTTEIPQPSSSTYKAAFNNALLRTAEIISTNLGTQHEQLVDARAEGRFNGTIPEPRAGLKSGHIPGAINLPFTRLYKGDGTLKEASSLRAIFKDLSLDLNAPIITSCGSGVTACNLAIAFAAVGKWDVAVYDGSWTEWGSSATLPIEQ